MSVSIDRLAAAIGQLRRPEVIGRFLQELLTPGEVHDLALRWELVELLAAGVSQRQIAARLGISLCKITRGAKILKKRNGAVAELISGERAAAAPKKTRTAAKVPASKKAVEVPGTVKAPAVRRGSETRKTVGKKHGTRVARKS